MQKKVAKIKKEITAKIKKLIRYCIGGCIVVIALILSPIVKVRFGRIYTARIGHLCFNIDNYLSNTQINSRRELAVFSVDKHISNESIYQEWKKKKNIYFSNIANYPLGFLEKYIPDSNLKVDFNKELHPEFTLASIMNPNIDIGEFSWKKFKKIHSDIKILDKYVCLHNRDSAYLNHYGSDGNNHDFRDFEFEDYRLGINKLLEMGFNVVRLGKKIDTPFFIDSRNFISLTEDKRSDFIDVAAIANSFFYVGGATGFSNVSRVLRKPELLINYIPFKLNELSSWAANSIILPKKIYNLNEKRYLTFREITGLNYDIHYSGNYFADLGLRVDNNSEEEIAEAIIEMISRLDGTWKDSLVQEDLQNKFWDSLSEEKYSDEIKKILGIKIGSNFLKRNSFLI